MDALDAAAWHCVLTPPQPGALPATGKTAKTKKKKGVDASEETEEEDGGRKTLTEAQRILVEAMFDHSVELPAKLTAEKFHAWYLKAAKDRKVALGTTKFLEKRGITAPKRLAERGALLFETVTGIK
jgi:hypothetical protein